MEKEKNFYNPAKTFRVIRRHYNKGHDYTAPTTSYNTAFNDQVNQKPKSSFLQTVRQYLTIIGIIIGIIGGVFAMVWAINEKLIDLKLQKLEIENKLQHTQKRLQDEMEKNKHNASTSKSQNKKRFDNSSIKKNNISNHYTQHVFKPARAMRLASSRTQQDITQSIPMYSSSELYAHQNQYSIENALRTYFKEVRSCYKQELKKNTFSKGFFQN